VGNNVYGYDLRNNTTPIITMPSTEIPILQAADEINQIVFSPTRRMATGREKKSGSTPAPFLAAADDSGCVTVTDTIEGSTCDKHASERCYNHGHEAMTTSLAFRPRANSGKQQQQQSLLLASGGTDCSVQLWSSSREAHPPLCTVCLAPDSSSTSVATNQICNPPMVHCLNWSPSGMLLAAGLGDGSVAMMLLQQSSPTTARLAVTSRLHDAHSGTVACCLFPEWKSATNIDCNQAISAHDRLFCTAGNDGCVVLWDLGTTVAGEKATNPATVLQQQIPCSSDTTAAEYHETTMDSGLVDMDQPKTLFAFQHAAKPNWMVSSRGRDPILPSALFVADTSPDITVYAIPLQ
jgi:WD repeat-containing protein 53